MTFRTRGDRYRPLREFAKSFDEKECIPMATTRSKGFGRSARKSFALPLLAAGLFWFLSGVGSLASSEVRLQAGVHAAGRGYPWLNLKDGAPLAADFNGDPSRWNPAAEEQLLPLSLSSVDFDEDNVPDLAAGYRSARGGRVILFRGNEDPLRPNSIRARERKSRSEFSDAPFHAAVRSISFDVTPDFLIAGDFDGDGHQDLAALAIGGDRMEWLSGDGLLNFGEPQRIDLGGHVTAVALGEPNRADGIADVLVAITGPAGAEVVVFEGATGAFSGERPERIEMPAPVTRIAAGEDSGNGYRGIVALAGERLVFVEGRDRRIYRNEADRGVVEVPSIREWKLDRPVVDFAVGNFVWNPRPELEIALLGADGRLEFLSLVSTAACTRTGMAGAANTRVVRSASTGRTSESGRLLAARLSGLQGDDLIVFDSEEKKISVLPPEVSLWNDRLVELGEQRQHFPDASVPVIFDLNASPRAVLPLHLGPMAVEDLVILSGTVDGAFPSPEAVIAQPTSLFTVTNTNASGAGSLRQAILDANGSPGTDSITFNLPGAAIPIINPYVNATNGLPYIAGPLTIDAGSAAAGRVDLDGSSFATGATVDGFHIVSNSVVIRHFVVRAFKQYGVRFASVTNGFLTGCWIGTNSTGNSGSGNQDGVNSQAGGPGGNTIGGLLAGDGNIISSNLDTGLFLQSTSSSGSTVIGNVIGLGLDGSTSLPNVANGIYITEGGHVIGGTSASARNVISKNGTGIFLPSAVSVGSLIEGNWIGTSSSGSLARGNAGNGIYAAAPNVQIGGAVSGAGNVISANGTGLLAFTSDSLVVQGNYVGTTSSGNSAIGNTSIGLYIKNCPRPTVGGSTPNARNLVSGNLTGDGIKLEGATSTAGVNPIVQGNYVGLNIAGTGAIANGGAGITLLDSYNVQVGGSNAGAGNVISNSTSHGIGILGAAATGGHSVLGNIIGLDASANAAMGNSAQGIQISGGSGVDLGDGTSGGRNVISGNLQHGIRVFGATTNGIRIRGNRIGTNGSGTLARGNAQYGISIEAGSTFSIGGTGFGQGNLISGNYRGIEIAAAATAGTVTIEQNIIGLDATGTIPLGNAHFGIQILAAGVRIGSSFVTGRNVISGNGEGGIRLASPSTTATILGNFIGTNAAGNGALSSGGLGISVETAGTTIGGIGNSDANTISGNSTGISLSAGATGTQVWGNFIGTDSTGSALIPNSFDGVDISTSATGNLIGGVGAGEKNVFDWSGTRNIFVQGDPGTKNTIRGNDLGDSLSGGFQAIDIAPLGTNANDPGDADSGPNDRLNHPDLDAISTAAGVTTVFGSFTYALVNSTFTIDVYRDPTGARAKRIWAGSTSCTTNASGAGSFSFSFAGSLLSPSATATDSFGSTSEASAIFYTPAPAEASAAGDMTAKKRAGTQIQVSFTPAQCGASTHAIFWGVGPIASAVTWSGSACSFGLGNVATFDPGPGPANQLLYFVIVGQSGVGEGSYGHDSSGQEIPQASGIGSCDRPQVLGSNCG